MPSTASDNTKTVDTGASPPLPEVDPHGSILEEGGWQPWVQVPELPELALAARPGLLVLTAVLLVGLWAALACWNTRSETLAPTEDTEKDLLASLSSPNLNSTSAEAPVPAPEPEVKLREGQTPELLVMPEPERLPEPSPLDPGETMILVPAKLAEPEEPIVIRNPHRGDSPMIHTWKMLGLQTILAGALAAAPAAAGPFENNLAQAEKDSTAKQLAELKQSIDELRTLIKTLSSDGLNANLKAEKAQSDIEEMKKQLAQLRLDVEDLRKRLATPSQVSAKYGPNGTATATGRVRLVNTFLEPMTIIVNGKAYPVSPGEVRLTEALPAGSFSYEVLGVQALRNRSLAANETFTINVHPR